MPISTKITVDFYENDSTGLIVAMSEEMKGLFIAGHSLEEVESRIPDAVRSLQEAHREIAAKKRRDTTASKPAGFRPMDRHREIDLARVAA